MSILNKVTTGRRGRAQKVVVYAPEGFGKSTLASQFPAPLFLDVEDSTSQLDVQRLGREELPDLKTFETALAEIAKAKPCATLVTDTVDWLETLIENELFEGKGVESPGYGKGYTMLRERMTILLARFDAVLNAGIHVVMLAHSKVVKFEPPDGAGPYDRYELKLSKQVAPLVKEWADLLVFANWRTQVKERDTKKEAGAKFKGVGGKERELYFNRCASWDAKNRHGLGDKEPWGDDATEAIKVFEKAFRAVNAPWSNAAAVLDQSDTAKPSEVKLTPVETTATPAPNEPVEAPAKTVTTPETAGAAGGETATPVPVAAAIDVELARICEPHAEAVTAYLRSNNKITANQDWRSMSVDFAARVKKNPAGFLKVAVNGKAVAA